MNSTSENIGHFLSRVILIIAVGFLFFLKSEKVGHNRITDYKIIAPSELKASTQAISIVDCGIPPIVLITLNKTQKTDLAFDSISEMSFGQAIAEQLENCKVSYFIVKPLVSKLNNYCYLPRYPDEYPSLS